MKRAERGSYKQTQKNSRAQMVMVSNKAFQVVCSDKLEAQGKYRELTRLQRKIKCFFQCLSALAG